jgi:hypothetical protein
MPNTAQLTPVHLLIEALHDLFPSEPKHSEASLLPHLPLAALGIDEEDDAVELGIGVENVLISQHNITPADLDRLFTQSMTVGEALTALKPLCVASV